MNKLKKKKNFIVNDIRENASQSMNDKNIIITCVNYNSLKIITKC